MSDGANAGGDASETFVAFAGVRRLAPGTPAETAVAVWRALRVDAATPIVVFNASSGHVVDLDLRGSESEVRARYTPGPAAAATRGRPKLGVVAREVTLLPRHWEWLACQPGGASVTLRRLVEHARKTDVEAASNRGRAEAVYRFMATMAGDLPGFEDASRALFSGDWTGLRHFVRDWPGDIQDHLLGQIPPHENGSSAGGPAATAPGSRDRV